MQLHVLSSNTLIIWCLMTVMFNFNINAKVYQPCQLAEQLAKFGFSKDLKTLGNWVCLAKFGSGFNTKAVNGPNPDGTYNYGIFQITDDAWCTMKKKGLCGVNCEDLLSDDISKSASCALKVFKSKGGFKAWKVWQDDCKAKDVESYVNKCELRKQQNLLFQSFRSDEEGEIQSVYKDESPE